VNLDSEGWRQSVPRYAALGLFRACQQALHSAAIEIAGAAPPLIQDGRLNANATPVLVTI
jgi:hypothetical protein